MDDAFEHLRNMNVGDINTGNIESNQQQQIHYQTNTSYGSGGGGSSNHAADNLEHQTTINTSIPGTGGSHLVDNISQHTTTSSHMNSNDSNSSNIHAGKINDDTTSNNFISTSDMIKMNNYQSELNLYNEIPSTAHNLNETNTNLYHHHQDTSPQLTNHNLTSTTQSSLENIAKSNNEIEKMQIDGTDIDDNNSKDTATVEATADFQTLATTTVNTNITENILNATEPELKQKNDDNEKSDSDDEDNDDTDEDTNEEDNNKQKKLVDSVLKSAEISNDDNKLNSSEIDNSAPAIDDATKNTADTTNIATTTTTTTIDNSEKCQTEEENDNLKKDDTNADDLNELKDDNEAGASGAGGDGDGSESNDEEAAAAAPLFPEIEMGGEGAGAAGVSGDQSTKPNGVTEVILMDEPVEIGEDDGVEEHQEDVLAGELADSEVASTLNVKPISNFIIKVKDLMKDENSPNGGSGKRTGGGSAGRRTPNTKTNSPASLKNARSNTPLELSNNKNNDNEIINNKKGETIDENQCRICLSKIELMSIFKSEGRQTIADKILTICTTVRIQRKDFLPQFICNTCMQSVQVAFNLKRLCEQTDKDLRSKLSRSKKNMRRPTEYVLLDATKFGDSDESIDDEPSDDDEFKISNEEEIKSSEPDSDDVSSDFGSNKRRTRRTRSKKPQARRSKPNSKSITLATTTISSATSSARPAPASVKRNRRSDSPDRSLPDDFTTDDDSEEDFSPPKKRASRAGGGNSKNNQSKEGHCVYCNELFPSQNALQKHKKVHAGEKPLICDMCGKTFKMLPSYHAHLTKHKEDGDTLTCTKCDKSFQKLSERRKHLIEEHHDKPETFPCDKCKRIFSLKKSLEKHIEDGKCTAIRKTTTTTTSSSSFPQQRRMKSEMENLTLGRDLFKCVAPVTTTYWSDSFSD